jgi:hypothetical protein
MTDRKPELTDYKILVRQYLFANPERTQSYFHALTRFKGESINTISENWLRAEYLRKKLRSQCTYSNKAKITED